MKDLLFKDIISWLSNDIREEPWITVFKDLKLETDWFQICSILVPDKCKIEFLEHEEWSLNTTTFKPDFVNYSDQDPKYCRWGIDSDYEPLVYQCFYNNIYPTTYEIIEEFKLYFNLFFDDKSCTYLSVNEYSDECVVIKKTDNEINISTKHLRQFLAAKKMSLGIQFDYFRFSSLNLKEHGLSESDYFNEKTDNFCYNITFQISNYFENKDKKINSRMLAKKILDGYSNFKPKFSFEELEKKQYCDFIIEEDINSGEIIEYTCNPNKLKDFIRKNSESPSYYKPVFFKRDVLHKYYQDSRKYTINDGWISYKGSWTLDIDNDLRDFIAVYLGDLGQNLTYKEQLYWRSYNVAHKGTISDVKFKRDFLTISSSPQSIDLVFKREFYSFKKKWFNKFNFNLFEELSVNDEHCLKSLRLPLIEDSTEFDTLVLNLSKILIDYLNEKEIDRRIIVDSKGVQGIGKFEILLNKTVPKPINTIVFLKQLQKLRSKGSAHRKGSDYYKLLKDLEIDNSTYLHSFEKILNKAIEMINELNKIEQCPGTIMT